MIIKILKTIQKEIWKNDCKVQQVNKYYIKDIIILFYIDFEIISDLSILSYLEKNKLLNWTDE